MLEIKQAYEVRIHGEVLIHLAADMPLYRARIAILIAAIDYNGNTDALCPLLQCLKEAQEKQPYKTVGELLQTV